VSSPVAIHSQLYVERDAFVMARGQGVVEWIGADLGEFVRSGQLLARLESTDQEIAVARARETLAAATRVAVRTSELLRVHGATAADSETAESQRSQAELDLRQAERNLALTRIVAPFDGVISARRARTGRFAAMGDSLFRVTAMGPLLASVQVPESAAAGLRVGTTAEVVGLDGTMAAARVIRLAPVVDAASGTLPAVLRVESAKGLRPGAAVTVRLGRQQRLVVAAPRDAIGPDGMALVQEGGRAIARAVTVGADLGGGRVEVVNGLTPGERVLRTPR
jgi:RND family efflux transporter MFP subunit